MTELRDFFGEPWVICFDGQISAESLSAVAGPVRALGRGERDALDGKLVQVSWEQCAGAAVAACKHLLQHRDRGVALLR
jgi:hypothetical protein